MGADPHIENNKGDTTGNSARGEYKIEIIDFLIETLKDWPVPEEFKQPAEEEERYEDTWWFWFPIHTTLTSFVLLYLTLPGPYPYCHWYLYLLPGFTHLLNYLGAFL